MRRVKWGMYERNPETKKYELVPKGEASFLQFGVDYEELDGGPGMYTTAVIELDNGEVKSCPVQNIKFITPPEEPNE